MGRYRQTWEGAVRERYHNANYRAKQKGFDFNLTVEYLSDLLTDQNHQCALTGDDLSFVSGNPKKLSLDRISSKGGYTQGNVQWVTWEVNDAKRALENEAFILLCQKVCAKVEGSETIPEGSTSQA